MSSVPNVFILLLLGLNRGESGHICLSYKVDVSSLVRQLSCSSGGFCGAIMFVCNTFQDNKESDRTGGKVIHTFKARRVAGILTDKHVFVHQSFDPFWV